MNNDWLQYGLKFSIVFAVLLGFYLLVFRKHTLHYFKRTVLLSIPMVALFTPLISLQVQPKSNLDAVVSTMPTFIANTNNSATSATVNWETIFLYGLIAVAFVLFIFTIVGLVRVLRIIKQAKKEQLSIGVLCATEQPVSPFSFLQFIVLHPNLHSNSELQQIIEHEQIHVAQKHVIDMFIAQLICVLFWWNPLSWLYRNVVIENLEFIVDREVLRAGVNKKRYQLAILSTSVYDSSMVFANHFNHSLIKNRITMMNKQLSNPKTMWRAVLLLPLLFATWLVIGQAKVEKANQASSITISNLDIKQDTIPTQNVTVFLDGVEIPREEMNSIDPETIATVDVKKDESNPNQGTIYIRTKKDKIPNENVTVFVDGVEIPKEEMDSIDPETIATVDVKKGESNPNQGTIFIRTRKDTIPNSPQPADAPPPPPPPPTSAKDLVATGQYTYFENGFEISESRAKEIVNARLQFHMMTNKDPKRVMFITKSSKILKV